MRRDKEKMVRKRGGREEERGRKMKEERTEEGKERKKRNGRI